MFTVPYPDDGNISDLDDSDERDDENARAEDTEGDFVKEIIESVTEEWITDSDSESEESNRR